MASASSAKSVAFVQFQVLGFPAPSKVGASTLSHRVLVFLARLRHPPRGQGVSPAEWQPLYVLKSFAVCSRLQLVIQECDGLFVMNQVLPTPIDLLSLLIVEFQSCLLQHSIGIGILEVLEIGST